MQKHKKWLIVTVWISTIGFVGAGFVGWGAYDYGSKSQNVATVGSLDIPVSEFEGEYKRVFSFYNQLFGGQLTQEQAKKFNIDKIALDNLVNNYLVVNYAQDIGIQVSDSEVASEIAAIGSFHKNGVFDQATYKNALTSAGLNVKDFEKGVKIYLLTAKVNGFFKNNINGLEYGALSLAKNISDRLSIQVIDAATLAVDMNEAKLKEYYEATKSTYKTARAFGVEELFVAKANYTPTDNELMDFYKTNIANYAGGDFAGHKSKIAEDFLDDMTKKTANKLFYAFKNNEQKGVAKTISEHDAGYASIITSIATLEVGKVSKPLKVGDGYAIVKLLEVQKPRPKTYDEAKMDVAFGYTNDQKGKLLSQTANNLLPNFIGEDVGFVTLGASTKIGQLDEQESQTLISEVAKSNNPRGVVMLGQKAILYKITEQKVAQNEGAEDNILSIKSDTINMGLNNYLKSKYQVETYYTFEG